MQQRRLLLIFVEEEVDIASLPLLSYPKIILQSNILMTYRLLIEISMVRLVSYTKRGE
jgi:hypothetical protein